MPQMLVCAAAFRKLDWTPRVPESASGTSGDLGAPYLAVGLLTPTGGGYTATLKFRDCSWELLPEAARQELFCVCAAAAAGSFPTILELFDRTVAEMFMF